MNTKKYYISHFLFDSSPYSDFSLPNGYLEKEKQAIDFVADIVSYIPRYKSFVSVKKKIMEQQDLFDLSYPKDRYAQEAIIRRILEGIEPYRSKREIFKNMIQVIIKSDSLFRIFIFEDFYQETLCHWSELRRDLSWLLLKSASQRLHSITNEERSRTVERLFFIIKDLLIKAYTAAKSSIKDASDILAELGSPEVTNTYFNDFISWLGSTYLDVISSHTQTEKTNIELNDSISYCLKKLHTLKLRIDKSKIVIAVSFSSKKISRLNNKHKISVKNIGKGIMAFSTREHISDYWGDFSNENSINRGLEIFNLLMYMDDHPDIEWIRDEFFTLLKRLDKVGQIRSWTYLFRGNIIRRYYKSKGYEPSDIAELILKDDLVAEFWRVLNKERAKTAKYPKEPHEGTISTQK